MTQLIRIGNSKGIRIPKVLIEQAHLEGKELKLLVANGGLLITPEKAPRQGWKKAVEEMAGSVQHQDSLNEAWDEVWEKEWEEEWLGMSLETDEDLDW